MYSDVISGMRTSALLRKVLIHSHFYAFVLFRVFILRLATGSGYNNSRSLAPVMTPGFGS